MRTSSPRPSNDPDDTREQAQPTDRSLLDPAKPSSTKPIHIATSRPFV